MPYPSATLYPSPTLLPGEGEGEVVELLRYAWEAGEEQTPTTTVGTVTASAERPVTGTKGAKLDAGDSYAQWTLASTIGLSYFFRFYLELGSLPSALARVFHLVDTGGGVVCSLRVFDTGVLQLFDKEGNQRGSTITLDLDKKYLIELKVTQAAAGNGTVTLKVDNEVIDDELSVELSNVAFNRLRIGLNNAGVTVDDGAFFDLVAVNEAEPEDEDGWIGGDLFPAPPADIVPSGHGRRPVVPIGLAQVNNAQLRTDDDRLAVRLVPDKTMTVDRFLMGFNLEGVDKNGSGEDAPDEINPEGTGREGYGDGNGGEVRAQFVSCNDDGTPNLSDVLATDEFNAVDRYEEAKALFTPGSTKPNQILFLEFDVKVEEGELYAVVISNVDADPLDNWFSVNCPTTSVPAAGPHRDNTLDEFADGAIAGLDPRECLFWSVDSGAHWFTGDRVGGDTEAQGIVPPRAGGHVGGYYSGFSELDHDEKVRLPWYAFMDADGEITAIQPYYNYLEEISDGRLVCRKAARSVTLTEAGGYAPAGELVGIVTVTNLATGDSGSTAELGTGLVKGELDAPVSIGSGETFTIESDGTVFLEQADSFQQAIFRLGGGDWPFTTTDAEVDRAALFALPWPYFAALDDPPPEPEVEPEHPTALGELLYAAVAPLDT